MGNKTITVKTNEENPEPVEIIADAIIKVSEAFDKIKNSKLTRKALLLLIHDNCAWTTHGYKRSKPSVKEIEAILDSIDSLKKAYIK